MVLLKVEHLTFKCKGKYKYNAGSTVIPGQVFSLTTTFKYVHKTPERIENIQICIWALNINLRVQLFYIIHPHNFA